MRVRPTSPFFLDTELEATVGARPGALGRAVLMVKGQPVNVFEALAAGYRLIGATEQECEALRRAGYPCTVWEFRPTLVAEPRRRSHGKKPRRGRAVA